MSGFCKKCRMGYEGSNCPICHNRKEANAKPVAIGVVIAGLALMFGFLLYTGGIQIDQGNLEQSIQTIPENIENSVENISKELPKLPSEIPQIPVTITEPIMDNIENIREISDTIFQVTPTSTDESKENLNYINQIRLDKGRNPISFDERVYDLALARVRDVNEYDYFDHTNPFTGSCPDSMKNSFGFSSNEYLAENLADGTSYPESAVDLWMTSQGHRYNLLYSDHSAGAAVCESGTCVFLGLNNNLFGEGCYVGAEGEAWHTGMGECSDDDFLRLDKLNKEYENLMKEYDKFPQMSRSQAEYQQAMKIHNELQSMLNQIENFRC